MSATFALIVPVNMSQPGLYWGHCLMNAPATRRFQNGNVTGLVIERDFVRKASALSLPSIEGISCQTR